MFLQPGMVPDMTWIDETRRFVEDAEINDLTLKYAAVFRRGHTLARSPVAEAFSLLRGALGARPLPQQGLLIAKQFYETSPAMTRTKKKSPSANSTAGSGGGGSCCCAPAPP